MIKKVRTTIVLPEDDIRLIKIMAINQGLTMSEFISQKIRGGAVDKKEDAKNEEKEGLALAGSLSLGGREPYKKRTDIYEQHLRRKISG